MRPSPSPRALACLVLLLGGCDAIGSLFGSSPPPPSTTATPPPTSSAASVEASPPPAPSPPVDRRAMQAAIREGRDAAHAGHTADALAAFDRALAMEPRNPRLLCESALLAHQLGNDALAASRMDSALLLFGAPGPIAPHLRVPVAMCLYNRGLVHVALHDLGSARADFTRSLALRPNATVQAHLDALGSDDTVTTSSIGDVSVEYGGGSTLVHAPDADALVDALAYGLRAPDGGGSSATLALIAQLSPLGWPSASEATLYRFDDEGELLANDGIVVAVHEGATYRVLMTPLTTHSTDDGPASSTSTLEAGASSALPDALSFTVRTCTEDHYQDTVDPPAGAPDDVECFDDFTGGRSCDTTFVACYRTDDLVCLGVPIGLEVVGTVQHDVWCEDGDGNAVPGLVPPPPPSDTDTSGGSAGSPFALTCTLAPGRRFHCDRVSGTDAEGLVGDHAIDELMRYDGAYFLGGQLWTSDGIAVDQPGNDDESGE